MNLFIGFESVEYFDKGTGEIFLNNTEILNFKTVEEKRDFSLEKYH